MTELYQVRGGGRGTWENDSPSCQDSETPALNLAEGRYYGKGLPPSPDADSH